MVQGRPFYWNGRVESTYKTFCKEPHIIQFLRFVVRICSHARCVAWDDDGIKPCSKTGLKVLEFENRSFLDWVVLGFSFTQLGSGEFLSFVLSLKRRSKNHHKSWKVCEATKNRHKSWEGL
jgi:hypothetical protein